MKDFSRCYIKKVFLKILTDLKTGGWVAAVIAATYFGFLRKYLYSICPVVMITGYPCPSCGMTRAGIMLLHFQFKEAFTFHPFIYFFVIWIAAFCINRYLFFRRITPWLKWSAGIGIMAMTIFYIWRMYHFFPGDPPMSYYDGNLLKLFFERVCVILNK